MNVTRPRRKPYTEIGIQRLWCARCGERRARYQWQICSDGNQWRPLCERCDVSLNAMVLRFMRFPNTAELINLYRESRRAASIQLRNPRSDRYVKVDRPRGAIVAHKKTPGPYKGVPIARRRPAQ